MGSSETKPVCKCGCVASMNMCHCANTCCTECKCPEKCSCALQESTNTSTKEHTCGKCGKTCPCNLDCTKAGCENCSGK